MSTRAHHLPVPLAVGILAVALAGCTGASPSTAPPSGAPSSTSSASPAPSSPTPGSSATAGAPQGPPSPRRLVEAGVSVQVPAGWSAASLDPASRQAAVAAEEDPKVAALLKSRLDGMATTDGVMYLYDFSRLDQGVLSAVEVYRYPGTDPQAVAEQQITPALAKAGLSPVAGTADLPAGRAVTVTGRLDNQGVSLTDEVALLVLGPSVVSLNATYADPTAAQVQAVLASVQAA